jgi:hypothetical protein
MLYNVCPVLAGLSAMRSLRSSIVQGLKRIYNGLFLSEKTGPYHYVVLADWGTFHDVSTLSRELTKYFTFIKTLVRDISGTTVVSELKGTVPELLFQADTLLVTISPTKATLFQQTEEPFTSRDVALRQQILQWYPNRFTLFLTEREPEFTIASRILTE